MYYLFFQIWVWLLLAFILGWFAHWFLCCRDKHQEESSNSTSAVGLTASVAPEEPAAIDERWKPQGFSSPPDQVDDLKRIKGVGSVIEETLNGLGIYQFTQISAWDQGNVSWVENFLAFPGRIGREDWVNQAATLSEGGTTEFANRVDKGDVEYD